MRSRDTIQTDQDRPVTSFPHRTTSTSFPRKRESTPVIRHSREGGNPQFPRTREFNENTIQTDQSPHSHTGRPQRHSHENGNPPLSSVIPAKAGIHNSRARGNSTKTPSRPTSHLIPTQDDLNVIPTKTGIHPCHPSFPRRRESTIPAHAGIHRPTPQHPRQIFRHSREDLLTVLHIGRICPNQNGLSIGAFFRLHQYRRHTGKRGCVAMKRAPDADAPCQLSRITNKVPVNYPGLCMNVYPESLSYCPCHGYFMKVHIWHKETPIES